MKRTNYLILVLSIIGVWGCGNDHSPEITSITQSPENGSANTVFTLTAYAEDEDNNLLSYIWMCKDGEFTGGKMTKEAKWKAPADITHESYEVSVGVSDGIHLVTESYDVQLGEPHPTGTFTDTRDGNEYGTVTIETQTWMTDNLAYLPSVNEPEDVSEHEPRYYVYDYEGAGVSSAKGTVNYEKHGVLYNWEAAMTACPDGWYLPTDDDWKILEERLGMDPEDLEDTTRESGSVGKKLKASSGWDEDTNGDNSSGFNALPSGDLAPSGTFGDIGKNTFFWTSTPDNSSYYSGPWNRGLSHMPGVVRDNRQNERFGFSVRCFKH